MLAIRLFTLDHQLPEEMEEFAAFITNKQGDKHGVEPTAEMLDEFKDALLSRIKEGDDPEVFDPSADAKGEEVLDQGAGYSGFSDFDFETGDGFDYSGET